MEKPHTLLLLLRLLLQLAWSAINPVNESESVLSRPSQAIGQNVVWAAAAIIRI